MPYRASGDGDEKMRALWLGVVMAPIDLGLCVGVALADEPARSYPPGYTPIYAAAVSYDWTGIYFGGQLGAVNSRNEWTKDSALENVEQSTTGFVGGVHAG